MASSPILIVRDSIKDLILEKADSLDGIREDDLFFTEEPEEYRAPCGFIVFNRMTLDKDTTHHSILTLAYTITIKFRNIDYKIWEDELSQRLLEMMTWFQRHPNLGCEIGVVNVDVANGIIGDIPGEDSTQSEYYFSFELMINYGQVDSRVEGY